MNKNRPLIAVYLLAAMLIMSAIYAIQGSLLTPMIEDFALTGAKQGQPNLAAFWGGIQGLLIVFCIQESKIELFVRWAINGIIIVMFLVAAATIIIFLVYLQPLLSPLGLIHTCLPLSLCLAFGVFVFKRHGFIKRLTKRILLRVALYICMFSLVCFREVPDVSVATALWGFIGFGLGIMDTVLSACMADLYPDEKGTRMMCILHTVFGLGSVLTPMVTGALLAGGVPYKSIYLYIAAGITVLILISAIVREVLHIQDSEQTDSIRKIAYTRPIMGNLTEIGLLMAMLVHGIFLSGLNTWINRYADMLPGSFSIPAQSFLFAGIMLSRLLLPFLPIRTDRYVLTGGIYAGLVLALGVVTGNGLVLRLALLIAGLLAGALLPCILTIGCRNNSEDTLTITTFLLLALYVGQGISGPVIGILESAFGLTSGIFLCALCMILTSIAARFRPDWAR